MEQPPSGNQLPGQTARTQVGCCIAGCGPAGAMLGLLLARAGIEVLVLEKHSGFLRDFRGDTLHPSTLQLFDELGLAEPLLDLPHQKAPVLGVTTDAGDFTLADFRRLPGRYRFLAFMPQWDFLDFVVGQARRLPSFELRMQAEALEVLEEAGRVVGLTYRDQDGQLHQVHAQLTVAADGRDSVLRRSARLRPKVFGVPMDVLWFRLPRRRTDPMQTFGRLSAGHLLVLIDRGAYWQIASVIAKDAASELRGLGLASFRASVADLVPFLADRVGELRSWDDVRTLRVQVDRLRRWFRPGLLCIGDAAHAMSPIGGVGINLAVHDAVATANLVARPLRDGTQSTRHLARVQLRRVVPTVIVQRMQRTIQNRFLSPLLAGQLPTKAPLALRMLRRYPVLQAIPARLIGIGVLPEHVRTPAANTQQPATAPTQRPADKADHDHTTSPAPSRPSRSADKRRCLCTPSGAAVAAVGAPVTGPGGAAIAVPSSAAGDVARYPWHDPDQRTRRQEPSMDQQAREQAFMNALATEHFVLQAARSAIVGEQVGRGSIYLGAVSSALIALGFLAQVVTRLDPFVAAVLPALFLLGEFTFAALLRDGNMVACAMPLLRSTWPASRRTRSAPARCGG